MPVLLPSPVFRWFVPAQNGTGLVPAAGYIAAFYAAGTDIEKTIYEPDGTPYPNPSNEATLNSEGYAEIWLGTGAYKLVVMDPDRAPVYTLDNITGEGSFSSGFLPTVIATDDPQTNGLAQYDTANSFVWCAGYYAIGDGGHGFFWNETSAEPDDGGYTIASTFDPTKVWFRIPDESGDVRAASFGYIGTLSQNLSSQLTAACAYAQGSGKRLIVGPGDNAILGTDTNDFYIYAPFIHFEAGSMLTGTGDFDNFIITGFATGTDEQHFTDAGYILQQPQVNAHPEWSGGSYGSLDNAAAFLIWFASLSSGGAFILPPGTWAWTGNTASFPYPTVPFTLYGTIHGTAGADIPPGVYYPAASRFRLGEVKFPNAATLTGPSASNIIATGDFIVTGSLSTTASSISSASHINAQGDINAGLGVAGGRFTVPAGISTRRVQAGGMYGVNIANATTSGTGATNLLSMSILASAFQNAGDHMRIRLAGVTTDSSAHNKTIAVTLAGITLATLTLSFQTADWIMEVDVWLKSSVDAYCMGTLKVGTAIITDIVVTGAALNFLTNQTLQVVGTAATSGDITQNILSVEYIPLYT